MPSISKADYLTAEAVEAAHRAGLAVSGWTVNLPLQMKEFIEMGVASIGTDYPDRLRIIP